MSTYRSPALWQHDLILQSLYSGRCGAGFALSLPYHLSQARSDVFFSLLFGGRIVCSAGAFFDSSIAIRVFGELFSVGGFATVCEKYNWRPLLVKTDDLQTQTPSGYLAMRLRSPKLLGLFREDEPGFACAPEQICKIKHEAAEMIERGEFDAFGALYAPFLSDYRVPKVQFDNDLLAPQFNEISPIPSEQSANAYVPSVLTDEASSWIREILEYLERFDALECLTLASASQLRAGFSPLRAVKRRAQSVATQDSKDYSSEELQELNGIFEAAAGDDPSMNTFHVEGPAIYGHYYNLVRSWIETDWHTARHRAYSTDTCRLTSNWHDRALFDFDKNSKAYYLDDVWIDDSLRIPQEQFWELDWSVLLDLVSDSEWRKQVHYLRNACSTGEMDRASDSILNLLVHRMSNFSFHSEQGRVRLFAKRALNLAEISMAASAFACHFECTKRAFHSLLGMDPARSLADTKLATLSSLLIPGAQWLQRKATSLRLRTAVVPRAYFGASGTGLSERSG